MATKSKLERAVEEQASKLNDARKELVMSQLSAYRQNEKRMARISESLSLMDSQARSSIDVAATLAKPQAALAAERAQLSAANSEIASKLFDQLDGKVD